MRRRLARSGAKIVVRHSPALEYADYAAKVAGITEAVPEPERNK